MKMNYKNKIQTWLEVTVIKLNLCPFANTPFQKNEIKLSSVSTENDDDIVKAFLSEVESLKNDPSFKTSLLILPNASRNFLSFFDIFTTCEEILDAVGLSDLYQIVCFHPEFVFENLTPSNRANFVNRSPLPLIHILSREDVQAALKDFTAGEKISLNNEEVLNSLTDQEFKIHFPD